MGRTKKLFLAVLLPGLIAMTMSGCVYVNNRKWDDMTPAEQEEVRRTFEEERKELEEDFSDDRFSQFILDKVEQAIEE